MDNAGGRAADFRAARCDRNRPLPEKPSVGDVGGVRRLGADYRVRRCRVPVLENLAERDVSDAVSSAGLHRADVVQIFDRRAAGAAAETCVRTLRFGDGGDASSEKQRSTEIRWGAERVDRVLFGYSWVYKNLGTDDAGGVGEISQRIFVGHDRHRPEIRRHA